MKVFELLSLYRKLFANMTRQGISTDDIMYLDMFKEYRIMLSEGRKIGEACQCLSEKYKVPLSALKQAIKRLDENYNL